MSLGSDGFKTSTPTRNSLGFPGSPRISSCMPRPVDSGGPPHPRHTGCFVLPSEYVKTLDIRNKLISKLYQHFRAHGRPYGLQDSLCTLTSSIVRGLPHSSMKPTLDTGGRLTLSRRGLAPRKRRRAYPGAITFEFTGLRGLLRRTGGLMGTASHSNQLGSVYRLLSMIRSR